MAGNFCHLSDEGSSAFTSVRFPVRERFAPSGLNSMAITLT
jgi:hypothetical protein